MNRSIKTIYTSILTHKPVIEQNNKGFTFRYDFMKHRYCERYKVLSTGVLNLCKVRAPLHWKKHK